VSHDPESFDLVRVALRVFDDPVARNKLRSRGAQIGQGDGVGKGVTLGFGIRVFG